MSKSDLRKLRNAQEASSIVHNQPIVHGFRIMDASSEEILQTLLMHNPEGSLEEVQMDCDIIPKQFKFNLDVEFNKLKLYGMITYFCVYIGGTFDVIFSKSAFTYFSDKEKHLSYNQEPPVEKGDSKPSSSAPYVVINGNLSGSMFMGDVVNSSVHISNNFDYLLDEIARKGGDDKKELTLLVEELRNYINSLSNGVHVEKPKTLLNKIQSFSEKHSWFVNIALSLLKKAIEQHMFS